MTIKVTYHVMFKISCSGPIVAPKNVFKTCIFQFSFADNDKENENRTGSSGQATQGVIQRRRRPKRRSTGVVHVDMDVSCSIKVIY